MRDFDTWLAQADVTDDPEGDLVGDMRFKPLRKGLRSLGGLQSAIRGAGGCEEAVDAAIGVWRRYELWRRAR